MSKLAQIIDTFQSLDRDFQLELLMDYAEKLPPVPGDYQTTEQMEAHRVHECQTPVSLWVELEKGKVRIYADVPRESPTVRGFIGLLTAAFDGATPREVLSAPTDVLQRSGLAQAIGMRRIQGLSAILNQVRREVQQLDS